MIPEPLGRGRYLRRGGYHWEEGVIRKIAVSAAEPVFGKSPIFILIEGVFVPKRGLILGRGG